MVDVKKLMQPHNAVKLLELVSPPECLFVSLPLCNRSIISDALLHNSVPIAISYWFHMPQSSATVAKYKDEGQKPTYTWCYECIM